MHVPTDKKRFRSLQGLAAWNFVSLKLAMVFPAVTSAHQTAKPTEMHTQTDTPNSIHYRDWLHTERNLKRHDSNQSLLARKRFKHDLASLRIS